MKNSLPVNHDYKIGDYVFVEGIGVVVKVTNEDQVTFLNAQPEDANRYATQSEIDEYNSK